MRQNVVVADSDAEAFGMRRRQGVKQIEPKLAERMGLVPADTWSFVAHNLDMKVALQ